MWPQGCSTRCGACAPTRACIRPAGHPPRLSPARRGDSLRDGRCEFRARRRRDAPPGQRQLRAARRNDARWSSAFAITRNRRGASAFSRAPDRSGEPAFETFWPAPWPRAAQSAGITRKGVSMSKANPADPFPPLRAARGAGLHYCEAQAAGHHRKLRPFVVLVSQHGPQMATRSTPPRARSHVRVGPAAATSRPRPRRRKRRYAASDPSLHRRHPDHQCSACSA